MTKANRPPCWRQDDRKGLASIADGRPLISKSPAKLQDVPWRDVESVIVRSILVSCGNDIEFVRDAQFFVENPQAKTHSRHSVTRRFGRYIFSREWPFGKHWPNSKWFHSRTEIERHGEFLIYRAFGIHGYSKTPKWVVWVRLRDLVAHARELMGRAG